MTQTRLSTHRDIPATAPEIFALLADPARHCEFDGSDMVGTPVQGSPIKHRGDIFRMHMSFQRPDGTAHEYQTDNHVTVLEPPRAIAWMTASAGKDPFGWEWRYDLHSHGERLTRVTLSYDFSGTTAEVRERFGLPLWTEEDFQRSLSMLEAAVTGAPGAPRE